LALESSFVPGAVFHLIYMMILAVVHSNLAQECIFWSCVSTTLAFSKTTRPNFTKFSVRVNCGRSSVLLWR